MAIPPVYKNVAKRILSELDTNLENLPDHKVKLLSELLSVFYCHNINEKVIEPYPESNQESLYLVTLGVLVNHFLTRPEPVVPLPAIPESIETPPPSPELAAQKWTFQKTLSSSSISTRME